MLRAWVVGGELDRRVGDGESGHEVLTRMGAALNLIADRHPDGADLAAEPGGAGPGGGAGVPGRPVVVGHVASLTVVAGVLCGLGGAVWGSPLPHAVPFVLRRDGTRWTCPRWPG